MTKRDRLRIMEVMRRVVEGHTELVCYAVVSGRGKELIRHAEVDEEAFARRLVASINGFDDVAGHLAEFDAAHFDSQKAKHAAMVALIAQVRRIVKRVRIAT